MSQQERYGTCSDENNHWAVERLSDGSLMAKGLATHDAADCTIEMLEEIDRLQAENERLRKAGDAMDALIVDELAFYEDDGNEYKEVKAWRAAKGVQP